MLPDFSQTHNPQDAVILTAEARRFEHMSIYASGRYWHWRHTYHEGKTTASKESYPCALEAALAAATVAHCEGIPVILPHQLQNELANVWRKQGADKFLVGADIDECWNVYQRQGFASAVLSADEITLMERDLAAMRRGKHRSYVRLSDEDMAAMEREAMATEWRS